MNSVVDPKNKTRLKVLLVIMFCLLAVMIWLFIKSEPVADIEVKQEPKSAPRSTVMKEPTISTSVVVSGLRNPWDVAFLPDGTPIVNERSGVISSIKDSRAQQIHKISDIYSTGEGGLTGMTLDADFSKNRYVYTCFNSKNNGNIDVRLVRWKISEDNNSFGERVDIVTGIPSNKSGRHSGCRVKSANDGTLFVGTGDAAKASTPQDPKSLGGKILRVTRGGEPVEGNQPAPFDQKVFNYGHRNVQGIALFDEPKDGIYGYSIEHGSDIDDEINLIKPGNFGWSPRPPYIEIGVPMTDLKRFPDAVSAVWSSGNSTIAPSGATILKGENWGTWQGAVAMAVLKDKHVRIMRFDESNKLIEEKPILEDFGRIRSVTLGPDGALYLTTDNGKNDKVVKVEAQS